MDLFASTHLFRRCRRIVAQTTVALLATLATLVIPTGAADAAAKKSAKCDAVAGWTAFVGRAPSFVAGGTTGLYIWQERGAWRIGATNDRGVPTTFAATVTFDAAISGKPVGTEGKSDIVEIRSQSVKLRFSNFGGLDGVQIDAPCASTISVKGEIDGQAMTAQQLFFGPGAANPPSVPGVIQRTAATTAAAIVPAVATSTGQGGAAATACSTAPWPASVLGRPAFRKGPAGIYVWVERATVRVAFEIDSGAPRVFEGRIVANAPVSVRASGVERRDLVNAAGQQVNFRLRVNASGDSFDVVSPCATSFSIEGSIDGVPLAASQVFVGPTAVPAATVPVIVSR